MATGSINISSNISRSEMILQNYPPNPCSNLTACQDNSSVLLNWVDPETDYTTTDGKTVKWKYTRIVRKAGSYPLNESDGTIVVESSVKNQYIKNSFVDGNLTNGVKYYYCAFSCSADGVYNRSQVRAEATPSPWKIMTVKIDLSNSNPETCGSYADNAILMKSGKSAGAIAEWQEFFGYKPCAFKGGKVVGYVNPNNYDKLEDGSNSCFSYSNYEANDAMVEFPRRGIRITKNNKIITVSMTDNPNDPNFKYYAHQRGSVDKDYFYLGVYLSSYISSTKSYRSVCGYSNQMQTNESLPSAVESSKANGDGYGCMGYYQWLYIQVMYLLQFKGNLNCNKAHGYNTMNSGYYSGSANDKGLMYGDPDTNTSTQHTVKLFGMEDIWGRQYQIIDNIFIDDHFRVRTRTDDSIGINDSNIQSLLNSNVLIDRGVCCTESVNYEYFTDCMGTTEAGFIPMNKFDGSSSTYFCTAVTVYSYRYMGVGRESIFSISADNALYTSGSSSDNASRLMYL